MNLNGLDIFVFGWKFFLFFFSNSVILKSDYFLLLLFLHLSTRVNRFESRVELAAYILLRMCAEY